MKIMSEVNQRSESKRIAWNKGLTKETNEKLKIAGEKLKEKYKNGELTPSFKGRHHSDETKKKLSEIQTNRLKENPENHPWKHKDKFVSEPCEKLKEILKKHDLSFFEEYTDKEWEHSYAIDIAFPEKRLAIEVNRKSAL